MHITKEDQIKLNYLITGEGEASLDYLAKKLYEYYSSEAVNAEGNDILRHQGAARLASWLQKLSKGLRDAANVNTATF